ncbi:hypothetical protein [Burkholderia glumae]|uniref:hypothetical protein n=1 Tax=Burkholderia glumae TaxID=337 RepID=UPI00156E1E85|nr:hypothetical protein [Burkholderia glumae]UVS95092.1 hypothetical protein EFP19_04365 [Burkholderia glumae]
MTKKDGGSAFPLPEIVHIGQKVTTQSPGMTLRDYFAAQALQTVIAGCAQIDGVTNFKIANARHAYHIADLMLEARDKA